MFSLLFEIIKCVLFKTIFDGFRETFKHTSSIFARFETTDLLSCKYCFDITGFTKVEFEFILNELRSLNNSTNRTKAQALAVYLFWLKTGLSQEMIAKIFGINNRQMISNYCASVRDAFKKDFVTQFIGINCLSRTRWLEKNTEIATTLFQLNEDQFCVIADGTYCYCEKSENHKLQKKLYGGQKKRHYIKIFIVCTTNGYIIDCFGWFPAVENDASILSKLMKTNNDMKSIMEPNDVILLDRGFRDCIKELKEDYHVIPKTPALLTKSDGQLTSLQANISRYKYISILKINLF